MCISEEMEAQAGGKADPKVTKLDGSNAGTEVGPPDCQARALSSNQYIGYSFKNSPDQAKTVPSLSSAVPVSLPPTTHNLGYSKAY